MSGRRKVKDVDVQACARIHDRVSVNVCVYHKMALQVLSRITSNEVKCADTRHAKKHPIK